MRSVLTIILHHDPGSQAGPLERSLIDVRLQLAERHRIGFEAAGAEARIITGSGSFAPAVRDTIANAHPDGAVVVGSGSVPLARAADRRRFVAAAASDQLLALANNRYSADVVAVPCASSLLAMPDLPGDNALPRWLEERAGYRVDDLRSRWRLQVDLDSPLDVVLVGWEGDGAPLDAVREKLAAVRAATTDPSAELLVAGRTSAATLRWLERSTACRVRALIEERGLRAASPDALGRERVAPARPPASLLGVLLERDGPESLGTLLPRLADAAFIDTRVLLANRLGADERAWPPPEDRFASDLLLADRIADPWLAGLTKSALAAPIPIVLGGHSLVGPGLRLALRPRR